jgi:hypothetical protein
MRLMDKTTATIIDNNLALLVGLLIALYRFDLIKTGYNIATLVVYNNKYYVRI